MSEKNPVSIWYLARYLKGYLWPTLWTLFFLILATIGSVLDPIWLKKIIDALTEQPDAQSIFKLVVVYFGIQIVSRLFEYLRDVIFAPAEMGISRTLSRELYQKLLDLQMGFHTEQKIGGLARKITRGGRAVTFILDFLVINILPTIFQLVVATVLLLKLYEPIYAIIIFTTVVIYAFFTVWSTEKRQKFRLGANIADDEVSAIEVDSLSNIETIKYFNNEPYQKKLYEPAIEKRYNLAVASNKLFALISGGQAVIIFIGLSLVLALGISNVFEAILTIGDLVLLVTYMNRLSMPISFLGFAYRNIKDGLADLDGMAKILAEPVTIKEPEKPVTITKPQGEIAFNNLDFSYATGRKIYNNLSFTIKPGERVAFVGPSGVGKSTVVKLLFRFYEPTAGTITVDGVALNQLSKTSRHDIFAIVPQEPVLFNATIEENIRFGKPTATMDEIKKAARIAHIDQLIDSLPDTYKTVVGERGVKLSGGEKQRVAIARAILRNPRVMVFDEATSSLDTKSEQAILEALDDASKGRTTIAVAHRLSTIVNSDMIYVLDKGGIAEMGTHTTLLRKNGLYAKLWRLQAQTKPSEEK